ncbi:MAG TPA: metal ABC transporter substrate-binding protein [Actinomycetales bacterium]|nr:metal ABC transporter substrate-binding protein [Actinomycetales bacterium]
MKSRRTRSTAVLAALLLGALGLTGCTPAQGATEQGRLQVVTSFYPLEFVVGRVGGPDVQVTSLTRPGVEPHDLELTARDVARMQDADLVVYLGGFQAAVDQAVEAHLGPRHVVDVAGAARLDLVVGHDTELGDEHLAGDDQAEEGALDPHFWLDPTRLADVVTEVTSALAAADPAAATTFEGRSATLLQQLQGLDDAFRQGLADCASRDLVTSHSAFGYLAERYGFHQVGITGLTPEAEPDPRSLARVATYVRQHHVTTIYSERLASAAVARTIAQETGASTAVLDPLEGLDDSSSGHDYLEVMRSNLETLRKGQSCR